MPRIAGVDIPDNKKILYSLQYVHGIGPATSKLILDKVGVDPDTRAKDLADHEVAGIAGEIDTNHVVEGKVSSQKLLGLIETGETMYTIETMNGDVIARTESGAVTLEDAQGNKATVTATDIEASNGVVHVIDGVLLP